MKQCTSVYGKFILVRSVGFLFFFLAIIIDGRFIILAFLASFFESLLRCPKCNHIVGRSKNDYIMIFLDNICKKCGQDLENCEVEPDDITNGRLE